MCDSMKKLIGLLLRCMVFGLVGGALFTVISGTNMSVLPYAVCMGLGAGWRLTKPRDHPKLCVNQDQGV